MIKAILFDFFGTIAIYGDMKKADRKVNEIIYNYLKLNNDAIEYEDFTNTWNNTFALPLTLEDKTEESIFLTKIANVISQYKISAKSCEISALGEKCINTWHSYISFPEDIHRTFEYLKEKYKLAIVSNFDHPSYITRLLKETGIKNYFDSIIISGEIGINKPDRRIFLKALEELQLSPYEAIFIGDSIKDDIEGALSVGCKVVLIDMNNKYLSYSGKKIYKLSELKEYRFE